MRKYHIKYDWKKYHPQSWWTAYTGHTVGLASNEWIAACTQKKTKQKKHVGQTLRKTLHLLLAYVSKPKIKWCSPHSSGKKAYRFCQDTAIGQQIPHTIINLLPYKVHTSSTAHVHAALSKWTHWSGLSKDRTSQGFRVQVISVSFSSTRPSEMSAQKLS